MFIPLVRMAQIRKRGKVGDVIQRLGRTIHQDPRRIVRGKAGIHKWICCPGDRAELYVNDIIEDAASVREPIQIIRKEP
jgi:hypothetical protein